MAKPLEGIRVIELATYVAAPASARVLADLGAEVIKIESASGDPFRRNASVYHMPEESDLENPCFDSVAVNKSFMALDLKSDKGKEVLEKLLEGADVFITNTREASLERLGLDYQSLSDKYPRLIYAHMLGYGRSGEMRNVPGFDYTCFGARGGVTATLSDTESDYPMVPGPAFGDFQASMCLTAGILAALLERDKTGKGNRVTASIHGTAVYNMSLAHAASQYGYTIPMSRKSASNPFNNTYRSKDGFWIQLCVPDYNGDYDHFVIAIGREDLVGDARYNDIGELCSNGMLRKFIDIIDEALAQKDRDEWVDIFRAADISFESCLTSKEVLEDTEAWDNGYMRRFTYPTGHESIVFNNPLRLESQGEPPFKPSRGIGADTRMILETLGYSTSTIDEMIETGVAVQHA